jgi:hypothetical protein
LCCGFLCGDRSVFDDLAVLDLDDPAGAPGERVVVGDQDQDKRGTATLFTGSCPS